MGLATAWPAIRNNTTTFSEFNGAALVAAFFYRSARPSKEIQTFCGELGMQQLALIHEDFDSALTACVQALGGAKKVGVLLRPEYE